MHLTLRSLISHGRVARRMGLGPESRINMLRNILTGLVRHERIETTRARADEVQFYAEKVALWRAHACFSRTVLSGQYVNVLIDYAKKGDANEKSMKLACFWLTEKDLIPKLFKVLAVRFKNQSSGYTYVARLPNRENLDRASMAVIEYKGNPFPPLFPVKRKEELNLVNQLLKGYREEKHRLTS